MPYGDKMENSSFTYHKLCENGSLMVIVPHEDDEINLAGALIYGARQEGIPVKCVFVTNGDWEYPAFVRINEALRALQILGVKQEDVFFLGYPDGGTTGKRSPFLHKPEEIEKEGGHPATYGSKSHPDFAYLKYGMHHDCSWENLLSDLEHIILEYQPSLIVATDFDSHPDHRMCYLAFIEVMNQILHKNTVYRPKVFMGYCYITGFDSTADFYDRHLLSTVVNRETLRNKNYETENPTYAWEDRIRLPVLSNCKMWLRQNILFHALCAHLSQKASRRAVRLVNGDEVFWRRRTDNLLYEGKVTASSGNSLYLHDFHMMNTKDIISDKPEMEEYLWIPEAGDTEKWCRCDFDKPCHIESVLLYGNIDGEGRILKGELSFSTGFSCKVGPLKRNGQATEVQFQPQDNVSWLKYRILDTDGRQGGLSEWEVFSRKKEVPTFIQITVDGNFASDWLVFPGEEPVIGLYGDVKLEEIQWTMDGHPCPLEDIHKRLVLLDKSVKILASLLKNPDVYSIVIVTPANWAERIRYYKNSSWDRLAVWWEKQMEKRPHHKLKKLRKH